MSVYERPDRYELLYQLLGERDETINISHKSLPLWPEHVKFVDSKPYKAWYFVMGQSWRPVVGACYLTKSNEIGVFIFRTDRGSGLGPQAVKLLMEKHGKLRYLANINPHNELSALVFSRLGFKLVQHTYELT